MRDTDQMNVVKKARDFATEAHQGQFRKYTDEPYIVHPIAVAKTLSEYGATDEVLAAALLHDTIEDTDVTYEDIQQEFGLTGAELVGEVTDVSRAEDGNRAFRKALDLVHLAGASADGQTIKLADLIDNTKSIVAHDPGFAPIYLREKEALLKVLTKGLADLRIKAWCQIAHLVVKV